MKILTVLQRTYKIQSLRGERHSPTNHPILHQEHAGRDKINLASKLGSGNRKSAVSGLCIVVPPQPQKAQTETEP